ncbi:MAG: ATP-binding cassette domain-containing protein [Candidatus Zeuxoniibacter abyssi]|nr:MAG: ATP-binding cassette domain-containing protein [Candidatus Persebacteraceae bacterium AB1(2)]
MNQAAHISAPPIWESPDRRGFIRIEKISKAFGDFVAVDDVRIDIGRGELFSLLGGSGCGKTTLLRIQRSYGSSHRANSHALQQHTISWDEQVYLSWHPKDAVVLTR